MSLELKYNHIYKKLEILKDDTIELIKYLESLLFTDRVGRVGFDYETFKFLHNLYVVKKNIKDEKYFTF